MSRSRRGREDEVRQLAPLKLATVQITHTLARDARGKRSPRMKLYAKALRHGAFGVVPVLSTAFIMYIAVHGHAFAVDFHNGEWPAGLRLLHGLSPYFGPHSAAVLSAGAPHPAVTPMVYPALGALLCAAFALLPHTAADITFTALDMSAVLVALRLLDVRDWRLYGLVFMWPPVITGWQTANITLLLVLGLAAVWRYRDRPLVSGLILAALVSIKVILWPLGLWLLATRRFMALGYALASALVLNMIAWSVIGFGEIPRYLQVLQSFDRAGERRAYSTFSLALHLGASRSAASALGLALASIVAAACFMIGRRGRDRVSFALCVAVALLATPIIWLHYFALLAVPLAVLRPRFSPVWLAPLVLLVCPPTSPPTWKIVLALSVAALVLGAAVRQPANGTARGLHVRLGATRPTARSLPASPNL
jgi:alpha-1,2-mannosyltransferase